MSNQLISIAVGVVLLLFIVVLGIWPTLRVWRRTGVNAFRLGRSESAHDYIGRWFGRIVLALAAVVVCAIFWPQRLALFGAIPLLAHPSLALAGLLLIVAASLWIGVAQRQMGDSWRIGIDARPTALVRSGLFTRRRNPIFLGMWATLLGTALAIPTATTLAILILGGALLQIQVRLEEQHLLETHGEAYRQYVASTRRWL